MDEDVVEEEVCLRTPEMPFESARFGDANVVRQRSAGRGNAVDWTGTGAQQGTGQFRLYQVYNGKLGGLYDATKAVAQLPTNDIFVAEVRLR